MINRLNFSLLVLLVLLNLSLAGCGREYHIKGIVRYLDTNNISTIKEVIVLPADVDGLLIPSAKVAMIFELNAAGSPVEGTKWITNSHTDSVGFFETGALANPEKKKFGWT